jgi:hypothetical protein
LKFHPQNNHFSLSKLLEALKVWPIYRWWQVQICVGYQGQVLIP